MVDWTWKDPRALGKSTRESLAGSWTEEERLRFFQGMGLRPEVVFWPGENRFRISLPVNLLAQTVVLLLGSGCPHLSVDVYRASGLAAISAETVSDFYAY